MRIVRFQKPGSPPTLGWVYEDMVGPVDGELFADFRRMEANIPIDTVQFLSPVAAGSKIICVGRNYAAHAAEHGADVPEVPLIFMKPDTSLLGHEGVIRLPPQSEKVEHEGELAVVIGKGGRWISAENALDHVFGYTIANDVTARDLQRSDSQWTRAKGFDTFCPIGPWIETTFNASDAILTTHVNGEMRQMASTRDMVFTIPHLVAFISSFMTLVPGDVILTGTPAGVGPLQPGDIVEVAIEGLGKLRNTVAADPVRTKGNTG